jgi:hypothetical protein
MFVKITDLLLFSEVFYIVNYSSASDNFRRGEHWNVDVVRIETGIHPLRTKDKDNKTPQYVNNFTFQLTKIMGKQTYSVKYIVLKMTELVSVVPS